MPLNGCCAMQTDSLKTPSNLAIAMRYSTYLTKQGGRGLATDSCSHAKLVTSAATVLFEASRWHNLKGNCAILTTLSSTLQMFAKKLSALGKILSCLGVSARTRLLKAPTANECVHLSAWYADMHATFHRVPLRFHADGHLS